MVEFKNTIINGKCEEVLKTVKDKSVQLICIDPPYNIGKDDWDDIWGKTKKGYQKKEGNFENYYEWLGDIFELLSMKLKDNGSFFFFHNDFRTMCELDRQIQEKTDLAFRHFIIWNKRFDGSPRKGFLDGHVISGGINNFQKMAEYVLFYVFDNTWKLKKERLKRGIVQTDIAKENLSKSGKITGWYSNIETGKNYPTKSTIKPIKKHLGLDIDDIVPKFRNLNTSHSVWNYDLDSKKLGHLTPKPINLLKNIILHTTDENDIVLDCFAGSGSIGVACEQTNRNYILIEKEKKYYDLMKKRIEIQIIKNGKEEKILKKLDTFF